jgi:Na+/H+ antiporter NhaC
MLRRLKRPAFWLFLLAMLISWYVGVHVHPTWTAKRVELDVEQADDGRIYHIERGKSVDLTDAVPLEDSVLSPLNLKKLNQTGGKPAASEQYVFIEASKSPSAGRRYFELTVSRHWGFWSLMPALVAVSFCWLTREPITALLAGIVSAALILGRYDLTEAVLVRSLMTEKAAGVLLLYLWLLGGLMGIWSRVGAAQAFADFMTRHAVRGPRSAKLVAWFLGVIFFQGGTVSTVLVGTTVKPLADKQRVSHEELAYVVDSTASPIASQLAFNAWPAYVQSFIFVAGVPWLATEAARIRFFFNSVPFCFYAIFAVTFTFLLSIERSPFLGKRMRSAMQRAREHGELDAPDAEPLSARELQSSHVPPHYTPHIVDFVLPLVGLIGVAVGTFIYLGYPQVRWAFGFALILAASLALLRGMRLRELMEGVADGLKGVVVGAIILLLAITIGHLSEVIGGGIYLVELLGDSLPYYMLPVMLQLMTIVIAFSTGTSWGTYAVAFPLAMPLAWAVASANGLEHPQFFMTICFAAVMDGSVYGDQCSPISDTTVLSAMCTGCDLMDHVKTQIPQATVAALLAAACWTTVTILFA